MNTQMLRNLCKEGKNEFRVTFPRAHAHQESKKQTDVYVGMAETLEEHLTCAICLQLYSDPVIFPCHHVFCKACVQPLVENARTGNLLCPECRNQCDSAALQTAFMINTLRDVYDKLRNERSGFVNVRERVSVTSLPPPDYCGRHQSQPLALYCENCQVFACRDCILDDKEHADHEYKYVSTLAGHFREDLRTKVTAIKEVGEKLKVAEEAVSQVKLQVDQQEADVTKKVTEVYESLFKVLEEEKKRTLAQLKLVMDRKRIVLDSQEQTLQMASQKVTQELEQLTTAVSTSTDQQIVKSCAVTEGHTESLVEAIELLSFEPLETTDVEGITPINTDDIRKACQSASIYYTASASKTQLTGDGIRSALTNNTAHFEVKLHNIHGEECVTPQDVVVQLKSLRNDLVTDADVTGDSDCPSSYLVSYSVETSGRYELSVLVNGQLIPECPLSIYIRKPPHQIWVRCVEISTLKQPTGLAITGEMLYVSELGANRLSIFNSKLEKLRTIENLQRPSEIALDNELNVYVCTTGDDKLHKFSSEDKLLFSVGGTGKEANQFNFPNGNCFHDQKLYVCDSDNNRIKVYDSDLNLLQTHNRKRMGPEHYGFPCDIAVDSQGLIYLVDSKKHRITVFNMNWEIQRTIGKKGTRPGELKEPVCIHIDHYDQIFVTEFSNNRISVFNTSGQFLATFGERYLSNPEGLTVDQDGFVYVSHSRQNVLVFC